jgi:hypothetical protein
VVGLIAQVSIVSLTNRTEPSRSAMLTPPGWKLEAAVSKGPTPSTLRLLRVFFWGLTGQ